MLGSLVNARLVRVGYETRVMSRRSGQDGSPLTSRWVANLFTGEGVDAAVRDAGTIVHCATLLDGSKETRATETLLRAARQA